MKVGALRIEGTTNTGNPSDNLQIYFLPQVKRKGLCQKKQGV
jgi:hypothetical protein